MRNRHPELNALGWSDWFEQRAACEPTDTLARVAAVDRDRLLLLDQTGPFRPALTGGRAVSCAERKFSGTAARACMRV
jgi:ribosome biogenesis GTPase / thiamine phosphate phosphatase